MSTPLEKAAILVEALPYIEKFQGKTVVIKYGGHAMVECELKKAVMQDIILMKYVGMNPVLVHGGGPEITEMMKKLNKKAEFVNGLRVTDKETAEIAEMVLVGKLNKEIVSMINRLGGRAAGLSGKDGSLIKAGKKLASGKDEQGEEVLYDIGFVGEVEQVNPELLQILMEKGYIPVVAPTGAGAAGETYNINADFVASSLAGALQADKLVLLTDVEGIFRDMSDRTTLISSLVRSRVEDYIDQGIISGGMIPKVQCCVEALDQGVNKTHIIDGRIPHAILLEIFTDQGIGTMVVNEKGQEG
jgi:acetylglutamate kinase